MARGYWRMHANVQRCTIPVLRARSADEGLALVEVLVAGGIRVIKITLTVPEPLLVLRRVKNTFHSCWSGLDPYLILKPHASACWKGQFIVSPALDLKTVELCRRYGTADFLVRSRQRRF